MSSQFKTGPIRYGHESFLIPLQTTRPIMRLKSFVRSKRRVITFGLLAGGVAARAQTVMNPNPNAVFSWNWADWSTINPTDLAVSPRPRTGWVCPAPEPVTTTNIAINSDVPSLFYRLRSPN
jgi:hypothetical protein